MPLSGSFAAAASADNASASSGTGSKLPLRPPVYNKVRGSKRVAFEILADDAKRHAAWENYMRDKRSAGDTSDFNLRTWVEYHDEWHRQEKTTPHPAAFPLQPQFVDAVGNILKGTDYRSAYNYLNAAKRHHIKLGFKWSEALDLAA